MGGSQSQPLSGTRGAPQETGCAEKDDFNAQDLLRHLQEQEGYEICDVFANGRARVPALLRHWQEGTESWQAACSSTKQIEVPAADVETSDAAGDSNQQLQAKNSHTTGDAEDVDNDHWVLLSAPKARMAKGAVPSKGAGKGPPGAKGKAPPPPPPPKAHGAGAKSKAKAKAKCGSPPAPQAATAGDAAVAEQSQEHAALPLRRQSGKAMPPPPFGKRLHWKLLPAASLGDTIFEELSPWGDVAPPLDTKQLERLFTPATSSSSTSSGTQAGAAPTGGSVGASQPGKGSSTQGRVCLLPPQRAQNLAIALRQVPISTAELCEVLRRMRFSHASVSQEALEHIYNNLLPPLLESIEFFKAYEGPPEALRDVERQLLPLVMLPRLKARLQSLLFGTSLPRLHSGLMARVKHLKQACQEVRDSAALRRLLGTVLRVGNFLNHGVDAPDAGGGVEVRGFAMESLLKLRDFRASQGCESAVSALHCIVLHLQPSEPQLPGKLREELKSVLEEAGGSCSSGGASAPTSSGSSVSISDLKEAVTMFRKEADQVQGEVDRFGDSYRLDTASSGTSSSPAPLESLKRLAEDARELADKLEADLADSLSMALRLLEYFGERRQQPSGGDAAGTKSIFVTNEKDDAAIERFFLTLREFASSLEACWREVLEQPSKLRLKNSTAAAVAASANSGSGPSASAASQANSASDDSLPGAGRTKSAERGLAKAGLLPGPPRPGLGLLAGDAVAAVRRRSRAAVPVQPTANRPVQVALSAASGRAENDASGGDSTGAGFGRWSGGRGYRSSISAAATEVD
eukprot:TRINITY_DN79136_c0_g1_i1.p1 TRINITY_DN79136_c0_g1~~TRINITY_DN79136_c0_g1_i1.p1  ORF type:complete len:803 (-),score=196.85 TRINITY_DN79136_c0_g1_i1:309-2717(-)